MKNINVKNLRSQAAAIVEQEATARGYILRGGDYLARSDEVITELVIKQVCTYLEHTGHTVGAAHVKMYFGVQEK